MGPRGAPALVVAAALLFVACGPAGPAASPAARSAAPTASVDIKRTKLDLTYTSLTSLDVHKVSSKKVLEGAIAAINAEITRTGGKGEFTKLDFGDVSETVLADFRKFADAAAGVKALNPQISADRFADLAVAGMIGASPDCHTYYVDKAGSVYRSLPQNRAGSVARMPSGGTSLGGPDEAGLTGTVLPGGFAYITFRQFLLTGTYKIADEFKKMLDKAVAAGAKAWVFDLRGNVGGYDADYLANYFLGDAKMIQVIDRNGPAGVISAKAALRLPQEYQLPIAVVMNDRAGSGPELFAADLRENRRAIIVGGVSVGCMGAVEINKLADGSTLAVVVQEFVGANTGFKYNGVGIPVDVPADDATAVDRAIAALRTQL